MSTKDKLSLLHQSVIKQVLKTKKQASPKLWSVLFIGYFKNYSDINLIDYTEKDTNLHNANIKVLLKHIEKYEEEQIELYETIATQFHPLLLMDIERKDSRLLFDYETSEDKTDIYISILKKNEKLSNMFVDNISAYIAVNLRETKMRQLQNIVNDIVVNNGIQQSDPKIYKTQANLAICNDFHNHKKDYEMYFDAYEDLKNFNVLIQTKYGNKYDVPSYKIRIKGKQGRYYVGTINKVETLFRIIGAGTKSEISGFKKVMTIGDSNMAKSLLKVKQKMVDAIAAKAI